MENQMQVYTIYDRVAEESSTPFLAINDGVAKRNFMNTIKSVSEVNDFQLVHLGRYNTHTMVFSVDLPVVLQQGLEATIGGMNHEPEESISLGQ
jgi:hypothetical protein